MARRRASPWTSVVILAVLAALLAGCAPTASPTPAQSGPSSAARDEVVKTLAASGIAVVASPADDTPIVPVAEPRSPLTFTLWQAQNLASPGAVFGFQLDEFGAAAGIPADAPPFSYVVSAWASKFDTEGARAARGLLGDRDWARPDRIAFSHLVLALFVSDMVRGAAATSSLDTAPRLVGLTAALRPVVGQAAVNAVPTVCGEVANFVDTQLTKVFNALKLSGNSDFATAVNLALDLAKTLLVGLVDVALEPILRPIRAVVMVIGVLATVASLLGDWSVEVTHSLEPHHFAHPDEDDHVGTFRATVNPGLEGWPDWIAQCSQEVTGVSLPNLKPEGKQVTWITTSEAPTAVTIATPIDADTDEVVQSDNTAKLTYETGRETTKLTGTSYTGQFQAIARIKRFEEGAFQQLLAQTVLSGEAGEILKAILGDAVAQAEAKIQEWMEQEAQDVKDIGYHNPHCLLGGSWRLDPASFVALLTAATASLNATVREPTGEMVLTFDDAGNLEGAANAFTSIVEYATRLADGTLGHVKLTVTMKGAGTGTYSLADEDSGDLIVDGAQGVMTLQGVTDTFAFTATATLGGGLVVPMPGFDVPQPLADGMAAYTCDPELLVIEPAGSPQSFAYRRVED